MEQGSARRKAQRDRDRAAEMKRLKIVMTTGRCAACYCVITVDSWRSRYTHYCWVR